MSHIKDLTGKKFVKLTAIKPTGKKNNKTVWLCKCDCGKFTEVIGTALTNGSIKSCGCLRTRHGMFGTRLYNVWHTMKERCYVPTQTSYENYGGKGISVCPEWQNFIPFMEWAYANGYDETAERGRCTLDRIDPNGDYCPENCRWVSYMIQANNKTDNVYFEYNGSVDTLTNIARRSGVNPGTAENRKLKGKSVDEIFAPIPSIKTVIYNDQELSVPEICKITGLSRSVIYKRVINNHEDINYVIETVKQLNRKPIVQNRNIAQYDIDGKLIKIWENAKTIEKETVYKKGTVQACCLGNNKTAYGFIWKYYDN